jgi:hypothetical protein
MTELNKITDRERGFVGTRVSDGIEALKRGNKEAQLGYFLIKHADDLHLDAAMYYFLEEISTTVDMGEGEETIFNLGNQGGFKAIVRVKDVESEKYGTASEYKIERQEIESATIVDLTGPTPPNPNTAIIPYGSHAAFIRSKFTKRI